MLKTRQIVALFKKSFEIDVDCHFRQLCFDDFFGINESWLNMLTNFPYCMYIYV